MNATACVAPPFDQFEMQREQHETAERSTMQEGQALSSDPAEPVLQLEISSPMKQEGQVDVETAQTLHSEIFSPLDHVDISTCDAILRNPRQRSNQFLVSPSW